MKKYYVYVAYLNNVPRYVGFGHGKRLNHVNSGTSHVKDLNIQVLKYDQIFDVVKVENNLSVEEAIEFEIKYIEKYGTVEENTGTLYNKTLGGIGYSFKHTQTTKDKIGEASSELWKSHSEIERRNRIDTFLKNGEKTRFVKGRKADNICEWKLTNKNTNECYIFEGKYGGPKSEFIFGMIPDYTYKRGKYVGWYLEKNL